MRVNAISSQTFGSTEMERMFAELNDNDLKSIAYNKAKVDTHDKRHRRLTNALFYSIPVLAGISSLTDPVEAVNFNKYRKLGKDVFESAKLAAESNGKKLVDISRVRGYRLTKAGANIAVLTAFMATFDAMFGLRNLAGKYSDKVNDFSNNHRVLSGILTFGAGIAVLAGLGKLNAKLAAKSLKFKDAKVVYNLNKFLNNNAKINKAAELFNKIPSSAKVIGKNILQFSPLAALFTNVIHSIDHEKVKNIQYAKNYADLKASQKIIREEIMAEDA